MASRGMYQDLKAAQRLFQLYAPRLGQEAWLDELLGHYRHAIGQTGEMMDVLGVAVACGQCALKGAGSCCFLGVENNYGTVLLLINIMLGYPPPEIGEIKEKCLFVGKNGCKLLARHYYCQRFLCDDLKAALGEAAGQLLTETVAKELLVGWEMEQAINQWLRQVKE